MRSAFYCARHCRRNSRLAFGPAEETAIVSASIKGFSHQTGRRHEGSPDFNSGPSIEPTTRARCRTARALNGGNVASRSGPTQQPRGLRRIPAVATDFRILLGGRGRFPGLRRRPPQTNHIFRKIQETHPTRRGRVQLAQWRHMGGALDEMIPQFALECARRFAGRWRRAARQFDDLVLPMSALIERTFPIVEEGLFIAV